jgi:DNA repair exonuclease SbcCD ATPase subunit
MPANAASINWEPVRECFAELRAQQDGLDKYLEESFEELDSLRTNLLDFQQELSQQRKALAEEWESLDTAKSAADGAESEIEGQLAALRVELKQSKGELETLRPFRAQCKEVGRERDQLLDQIVAAQNELAALRSAQQDAAGGAAVVAQMKERLEAAIMERDSLRTELEEPRNHTTTFGGLNAEESQVDGEDALTVLFDTKSQLQEALQQVDQQASYIRELEDERGALDNELDTVRGRAAELNDTLVQTKRQIAEERAEWSCELRQMRQVLDRHTKIISGHSGEGGEGVVRKSVRDTTPVQAANGRRGADAVVGSIVAQFERLRHERAQQRAERQKDLA